jgi:K+-transporting ATPase ATPase C chain
MSDAKVNFPSSHRKATITAESGGSILGHIWASVGVTIVLGIICCGIYPLLVWGIGSLVFPWQANGSLVKADGSQTTDDSQAVGSALIGQAFSAPIYFTSRFSANSYDATNSGGTNLGPLSDKLINGLLSAAPPAPATQPATPVAGSQPAASQPAVTVSFDGIRLRTLHYAVNNGINFKLYHATYHLVKNDDGTISMTGLDRKEEVPLKNFQDSQGNLMDVALIAAFPHPVLANTGGSPVICDAPAFTRVVLIADDFTDSKGNPVLIPGDAVTGSGSGLDPHISPANAELQINRVASARSVGGRTVKHDDVEALVQANTDGPNLGVLGDPGVNVLMLNLALDKKFPMPAAAPTPTPAAGH